MILADLLKIAENEIGVTEYPSGSNSVKYNKWFYGYDGRYAWCMTFVQWCFDKAGQPLPLKTAGCTTFMNWCKKNVPSQIVYSDFLPGDVVLFDFDNDPSEAEHVGIISAKNSKGVYQTIEGNTSLTSDDNGGAVMFRTRYASQIICAYRPKFTTNASAGIVSGASITKKGMVEVILPEISKGSKGNTVKAVQILLIGNGFSCGSSGADGDFGVMTDAAVKAFQKSKGIAVDGIVGKDTYGKLML